MYYLQNWIKIRKKLKEKKKIICIINIYIGSKVGVLYKIQHLNRIEATDWY